MIRATIGNNVARHSYIIDENTTIRKALEDAGIDYSIGMTSLDGSTLGPGDMDKTFAEFGITEKCYVLNVVKADNAAKIKIAGNACVVESGFTLAQIKQLEKFRPNALALTEGEGANKQEVFRVGTTKGSGSINAYGASFGAAASASGKATITMMIPDGVEDPKKWAADKIGVSIIKLDKVEEQYAAALEAVKAEQETINAAISVM